MFVPLCSVRACARRNTDAAFGNETRSSQMIDRSEFRFTIYEPLASHRDELDNETCMMQQQTTPRGWLAFEQNVLARMDFKSAILPFTSDPALGVFLKRRGVRVSANDLMQSAWTRAVAAIQNSSERLSDDDVNAVLEDVYVPGHKLRNPALRGWFTETDSWWFDNVRAIDRSDRRSICSRGGRRNGGRRLCFVVQRRNPRTSPAALKRLSAALDGNGRAYK